jgi:preprotein translocase subunit YajC
MFLISTALAADGTANVANAPSAFANFLPLILIFGVFYFMMIRPQIKKQKDHQEMLNNLKRGDKIVTTGGIIGSIIKIEEDIGIVNLEIAPNVRVRIIKSAISDRMDNTVSPENPIKAEAKEEKKELEQSNA